MLGIDGAVLVSGTQLPSSIVAAMPRGTRADTAARARLCQPGETANGGCPPESRIGFGRYVVTVGGFLLPGGVTQLTWGIEAFLGKPEKAGDVASVVLVSKLLGADSVAQLLAPALGTAVPATATSTARLVRTGSGPFGLELRMPGLPVQVQVSPPVVTTPTRLELALSAVRRTRKDFTRRIKVRTPGGYRIRKVRDHRLVGHDLLRAPRRCGRSWPYELRIGFAGGEQRSGGRIGCSKPLT